ncbi:MAG: Mth938-like domain-containing protein [Thermoanaerobaculia bacterium]|nr:Mth938-like domain-containing protein [Thermoanaerobaculia bacterium]
MKTPAIDHLAWGRIEIGDETFKDAKVYPGGARAWDWNETGTRHSPGIQPSDVEQLLEHGAEVIILSRGMWKRLHTADETLTYLEERGIEVQLLPTPEAVDLLNELRATKHVGGLFHSTC